MESLDQPQLGVVGWVLVGPKVNSTLKPIKFPVIIKSALTHSQESVIATEERCHFSSELMYFVLLHGLCSKLNSPEKVLPVRGLEMNTIVTFTECSTQAYQRQWAVQVHTQSTFRRMRFRRSTFVVWRS